MLFRVICHLQPAFAGRFVSFRFAAGRRAARFRAPPGGGSQFRGSRGAGFGAVSGALSPAAVSFHLCRMQLPCPNGRGASAAGGAPLFPCGGCRIGLCPASGRGQRSEFMRMLAFTSARARMRSWATSLSAWWGFWLTSFT